MICGGVRTSVASTLESKLGVYGESGVKNIVGPEGGEIDLEDLGQEYLM